MARVKHTGDLVGTPHGTRRLPKPEPRPKPDIEAENFNEEDAARLGAVLYDLYVIQALIFRQRLGHVYCFFLSVSLLVL